MGSSTVNEKNSDSTGYVLAAILGAIGGGLVVLMLTKAIPKMMSQMMQNMMTRRRDGNIEPSEF